MNWFNIILVLVGQAFIFWNISQMYEKTSPFFNVLKSFFLIVSLFNIVVVILSLVIMNDNYTYFNSFANILFYIDLSVMVLIILSYGINFILEAVNMANKVSK